MERELQMLLSRLGPEAALAHLDGILAKPPSPPGDRLSEARIMRVLAAAHLAWCASRQPSLIAAARDLARSRAAAEADPLVRQQLVWILAGIQLFPISGELGDEEGRMRVVEAFARRKSPGPSWAGGLAAKDPPLDGIAVRWLIERGGDRKEPAREAAVRALLASGLPEARRGALEIYVQCPWARPSLTHDLAGDASADVLSAFVTALPSTRDTSSVQAIARALEKADQPPEGSGRALLNAFQNQSADASSVDASRTRSSLARAAVRTISTTGEAGDCVGLALADPSVGVNLAVAEAAIDFQARGLTEPIRAAWRGTAEPYRKATLAYALRGLDPAFQEPNPFWDLRALKTALSAAAGEPERRRILNQMQDVEAGLNALRSR